MLRTSVGPATKATLALLLVKVMEATSGPETAVSLSPVRSAITATSATGRLECTSPALVLSLSQLVVASAAVQPMR